MRDAFRGQWQSQAKKLVGLLQDALRGVRPPNQLYRRLMIAISTEDPSINLAREISLLLLQLKTDVVVEKKEVVVVAKKDVVVEKQ